jgi:hypothetical protein
MVSATLDKDTGYTTTVRQKAAKSAPRLIITFMAARRISNRSPREPAITLPNSLTLPQAGLRVDWAAAEKDR